MADPVALDPGRYGGTYKLVGGSPALDFANLVSYRDTPDAHDWLRQPNNLERWVRAADLDVHIADGVDELIALREALTQVFLDVIDAHRPTGSAFDRVAAAGQVARARQQLVWDADEARAGWTLQRPSLREALVLDAADLLTDDAKLNRLGACDECCWVYLDTTRNRSRRWCDPADCGNRARQRRHYQRR